MLQRVVGSIGLAAILVVLCSCGPDVEDYWNNADSFPYPEQAPQSLDIVSYNVFLRPTTISTNDYTDCRGRQIGETLASLDADVVALQEAWQVEAVASMIDASEDALPFRVVDKPSARLFTTSSGGLSVLSRWPVEDVRTMRYDRCHGEDCFATKGALHVVIRVSPSHRINVVNTHLDSGKEGGDREARAHQLDQLREFIAEIEPSTGPVVLLGDFNVDAIEAVDEYEALISRLRAAEDFDLGLSTVNCSTNVSCDRLTEPQQLDYVFTRAGENRLLRYRTRHLPLATSACGGEVNFLSDHRAVSATYDAFLR
jgi:endonuclease/exonuclease/phosphatase family metal-dependent hydrolase